MHRPLPTDTVRDTLIPLLCHFEFSRHEATRIPGNAAIRPFRASEPLSNHPLILRARPGDRP